jgi:pSer/pThr/pTyr-binding forkhead associated (FHA) protein
MASITVSSEGAEQTFPLETPSVTIGRGLESDIRLKDIKASRRHCQIVKAPKGYQVVDLSSGNGTLLNGNLLKQQSPLSPGDRIQIGGTVITFVDAPAAAAKPKGASSTGVMPKAQAAASKTTQSSKVATSQIPVAQTRKITQRIDAAKPSTQSIPKAGSTAAMKKTTQRAGTTGRMAAVSATQRLKADQRRKRMSPLAVTFVLIGVIFVLVIGLILAWPKDDSEFIRAQLEGYMKKAVEAENADKFDVAIREFNNALALCVGDRYKTQAAEIKGRIKQVEENKSLMAGAAQKWAEFKAKVDKAGDAEAGDLLLEGKKLKEAYGGSTVAWLGDLTKQIEVLQKMVDTRKAIDQRQTFQNRRQEITEKHRLGAKDGSAQYAAGLKDWKDFLAGKASSEEKTKAQGEINTLNVRAKEEVGRLRTRANNLKESGKKDEAVELLKKERARFEGTEVYSDLEKLIAEIEK